MRTLTRTGLALALACVLAAGATAACGKKDDGPEQTGQDAAAVVSDETAEGTDEPVVGTEADTDTDGDAATGLDYASHPGSAQGTIDAGAFTFEIPAYWAGKVDCSVADDGEGNVVATVYLPDNPDATLATLVIVEGDEPEVAGDIGYHLAGSVKDGNGSHVEVWTLNWPWLVASGEGTTGFDFDEGVYARLVDLSTGGALRYEDVAGTDPADVGMEEADFSSSALVSTVAFG